MKVPSLTLAIALVGAALCVALALPEPAPGPAYHPTHNPTQNPTTTAPQALAAADRTAGIGLPGAPAKRQRAPG